MKVSETIFSEIKPQDESVPVRDHQSLTGFVYSDCAFVAALGFVASIYFVLIVSMLAADTLYTSPRDLWQALNSREIQYSIKLSLFSCTVAAVLSVIVGIAAGYLLSRYSFPGKSLLEAIVDIPIVLPPLVVGLSLLILFQTVPGKFVERFIPITYAIPSVIIAQFAVACAFAIRTMRVTFDQISPRQEQVALTLGCTQAQAFRLVLLPEARRGIIAALTLSWTRSLGEFGPILIFSGATRMRTEVLPTTIFLELSIGNLEAALAISLLMVIVAIVVLLLVRRYGHIKGSLL